MTRSSPKASSNTRANPLANRWLHAVVVVAILLMELAEFVALENKVLAIAFALSVIFGAIARRTGFCTTPNSFSRRRT